MELLGFDFTIKRKSDPVYQAVTPDANDGSAVIMQGDGDGAYAVSGVAEAGMTHTATFDVDPSIVSEHQLITKYREISLLPEIEKAIDHIINEMISTSENKPVEIDLDEVEYSDALKNKITEEFKHIINLMDFNHKGWNILKRWYIDGRHHYQVVIDDNEYTKKGIGKLVYIDPRKIKKVRVQKSKKDPRTGVDLYTEGDEFFLFSDTGFSTEAANHVLTGTMPNSNDGVKIAKESIVQVTSDLLNPSQTVILSYLHKAIRPLNQLRGLEDAALIYRIARAPERRVFYIDVGNLPVGKAEQQLKRQMNQYKNKVTYDSASGSIRSDSKQLTMLEDFWLARTGDGKATQIDTLPGGQNLGQMEEVQYFLNKLYNALNVPITRMDPSVGFSTGRSTEITRDEVFFIKFVERLQKQFSNIFLDLLRRQLALKGIMNPEEFDRIRNDITFEWKTDTHWDELLELEIMTERLNLLDRVNNYKGQFWSVEWIKRNLLKQSQEEIDEIAEEMEAEKDAGVYDEVEGLIADDPNVNQLITTPKPARPRPGQGGAGSDAASPTTPAVTATKTVAQSRP